MSSLAAVVVHKVEEYSRWKREFDSDKDMRSAGGIVSTHINRGAEDSNLVAVYLESSDGEKLKSFLNNDALKEKMQDAGVVGKPTINLVTPVEDNTVKDEGVAGAIVNHRVNDYAKMEDSIRR